MDQGVTFEIISYYDVEQGKEILNDDFGIAAYTLTPERKLAFLSNPNLSNKNRCMDYLARFNGKCVGRVMFFPTRVKAGDEIIEGLSGSSLVVHENYRKTSVAVDLIMYPILNKANNMLIYADFSDDGISVYRSLKYKIFSILKFSHLRKTQLLFEILRMPQAIINIFAPILNLFVCIFDILLRSSVRLSKYKVKEVKIVPDWIDHIVLNEAKYMEVHDHRWMQWNLDNMFHKNVNNKNRFFVISLKDRPVGFFFLKERHHEFSHYLITPKVVGSIVEWGITNESGLSEFDIIRMASKYFSENVDYISVVSSDLAVIRKIKRLLYFKNGLHHIVCKDLTKRYRDSGDMSLWRLRYGYADSILN